MWSGRGWSLIAGHVGSPARRGLTDLFAVGGFDALTRLRRLGEDVLRPLSASWPGARHEGFSNRAVGPLPPSTRGQVPLLSTLLAA